MVLTLKFTVATYQIMKLLSLPVTALIEYFTTGLILSSELVAGVVAVLVATMMIDINDFYEAVFTFMGMAMALGAVASNASTLVVCSLLVLSEFLGCSSSILLLPLVVCL